MQTNTNLYQPDYLHQIKKLIVGEEYQPGDHTWQPAFMEMIVLLDDVLYKAEQVGKRISFHDEVGVNGQVLDITSLVQWMRQRMTGEAGDSADQTVEKLQNRLNRYRNSGVGYFANGVFFSCDYDDEIAFFLDDRRIYLNRHIRRAILEAETDKGVA